MKTRVDAFLDEFGGMLVMWAVGTLGPLSLIGLIKVADYFGVL